MRAILTEIGYAGAALARELPDGSLELIDGHLRSEETTSSAGPLRGLRTVLGYTSSSADACTPIPCDIAIAAAKAGHPRREPKSIEGK